MPYFAYIHHLASYCWRALTWVRWTCMQVLGLWGMGGIGKTTLASALFNHLQPAFADASCFLLEVRSQNGDGFLTLQMNLLKALTGANMEVHDAGEGAAANFTGHALQCVPFCDNDGELCHSNATRLRSTCLFAQANQAGFVATMQEHCC